MKPHHRIFGVFFIFSMTMGTLLSRLPDLQLRLGLSEGQLGLLLLTMSLGALFGLTFSSPLIAKLGARTTAFVTVFGASLMYALIPWVPSAVLVAPLFFVAGLFAGALEINVNLETDRHEAKLGFRIMNRAHGMWSLGFFVTMFIASTVRQAGISVEAHTFGALVMAALAGWFVFRGIENAPARPDAHEGKPPLIAFPTLGLAALCLIGAAPLLVEGAGIDWSAIYMRDVFGAEPFVATSAVTLFSLFMAVARLSSDPIVDRFGPRTVVATMLVLAVAGLICVAIAPNHFVALAGFALMGVGCSAVYPLAVSAAAQRTDRPASINVAALGQLTFVVFFVGPPLLGFVAQAIGIRNSYWAVVPLVIAALLVVKALPPKGPVLSEPSPLTPQG
ncbi:MAG TPA: MFS transporter [Devosia sp.]|nr:MFS transporter [Devosia sp.]